MPHFAYQAEDAEGALAEGTLEADSLADAAARLEEIGLTPHSLRVVAAEVEAPAALEPVALSAAVQRLLAARDQLAPALAAYASELPPSRRRRRLRGIARTLSGDETMIRSAIAGDPLQWAPLLAATAGDNEIAFARFFDYDRREREGRRKWRLATSYPLFLLTIFCLFAWPFSAVIVPTFSELYDDFGLELPAGTQTLIAVCRFIERGGAVLLLAAGVLATIAWRAWPRWVPTPVAYWVQRFFGVFGVRSTAVAKQARQAGALLQAGAPPEEASRQIDLAGDLPLRPALAHALTAPMPEAARPELLHQLDRCYRDHTRGRASWRRAVIGPGLTITLGVLIGYAVMALFIPLVSLLENLS